MKIVVISNDKIDGLLVQQLSREGHEVVVIDSNPTRLELMQEELGIAVVPGNGASIEILRKAGADSINLLVAMTNGNEVNLLTTLVAERLDRNYTVTRIRSPEHDREANLLKTSFGINASVNPEETCVREIFRLLQFPTFLMRNLLAGGHAGMVELIVSEEGKLTGRKLSELANIPDRKALICTTERNGEVLIPSDSTELHAGDKLGLVATAADLPALLHRFDIRTLDVRNVIIIGDSAIARCLATDLLRSGLCVTILEMDLKKCEVLEDLLPDAAIIHDDGSLQHVLTGEGIASTDAVVPLTDINKENIMIPLYTRSVGTKKTITKVNRTEYVNLFGQEHFGAVMSPKVLTANGITRCTRVVGQTRKGSVETLHTLGGDSIESFGFTVPEDAPFVSKPITELPLQPSILIASVVGNQRVIIPGGQDCLIRGNSIVVTARASQMVSNLADIFRNRGGET